MPGDEADFTLRLINDVTRPAKEAGNAIHNVEKSFGALDVAAGEAIVEVAKKVGELGLEVVKFGVEAVKSFGEAAIEAASFAQTSKLAIGELTHSATAGAIEFDNVRKMAQGLGLDVHDTVHSFQELLAAQFSIGQSKDIIKLGGDMQVIGASAQQVQSIFLAMSQIKSVGVLQGGDLRQLEQAGISGKLVYEQLAKQLGVTVVQVQKLQQAGKISADTGIGAIMEAVKQKVGETDLGEVGAKFADSTLKGAAAKLRGGFENAMIDIGTAIQPSLDAIGSLITGTFKRLSDSGILQSLSDSLVRGFTRFADFIQMHWPEIESAITTTINAIVVGVDAGITVLNFMNDHWTAIKTTVEVVGIIIGGVLALIGLAVAAIAAIVAAPLIIEGMANDLATRLVNLGVTFYDSAVGWASQMIQGLVQGIEQFGQQALDKVTGFAGGIADSFKQALGIASPSKVFAEMGGFTAEGFGQGLAANDNVVKGATADMAATAAGTVQPGSAAGGATGGGNTITINITLAGAQGGTPAQVADELATRVRRELQLIFDAA